MGALAQLGSAPCSHGHDVAVAIHVCVCVCVCALCVGSKRGIMKAAYLEDMLTAQLRLPTRQFF